MFTRVFTSMSSISPFLRCSYVLRAFIRALDVLERARGRDAKNRDPLLEWHTNIWYIEGKDEFFLKNDRYPNISITINRLPLRGYR